MLHASEANTHGSPCTVHCNNITTCYIKNMCVMRPHCCLLQHMNCNTWNSLQRCKCDTWSHIPHTDSTARCYIQVITASEHEQESEVSADSTQLPQAPGDKSCCTVMLLRSIRHWLSLYRFDGRKPSIAWSLAQDQAYSWSRVVGNLQLRKNPSIQSREKHPWILTLFLTKSSLISSDSGSRHL